MALKMSLTAKYGPKTITELQESDLLCYQQWRIKEYA
jgi:hypothetical protein